MTSPPDTARAVLYLERRKGTRFDQAWHRARAAALLDAPNVSERQDWAAVFDSTREEWQKAYENRGASLLGLEYLAMEPDAGARW